MLKGCSVSEFSVALTNGNRKKRYENDPYREKHRSTIISKGISAGKSQNSYRGLVKILPSAHNARNFTQCDSMLIGTQCGAYFHMWKLKIIRLQLEHEATTSRIGERPVILLFTTWYQRRRCDIND
ncbi:SufD family Fe-S cluster assembly protein [Providencia rettgeri]|nr:SufD family Fe-S cluster assembly protein [Providencia rettgeri]